MSSRRDFLGSAIAALGTLAAERLFSDNGVPHPPFGVQLYTVRRQAEANLADLSSLLKQIYAIGYDKVETYWNVYSIPAKDLRRMIVDAGLAVPSGHFDYKGLPDKFDYARELGVSYAICPMLPEDKRNTADDFRRAADRFNQWGERARSLGMRFGFHNHNYEFRRLGDTTGFDLLVSRTDPNLVCFEMDCYWITEAGQDPVAMMEKLGQRVRMLHLKDRKPGFPPSQQLNKSAEHFTEVGNGTIDWLSVLKTAKGLQIEHLFVEQDESDRPPMESLNISYKNLQRMYVDMELERLGVVS